MAQIVLSLQRAGSAAVLSLQFPSAAVVAPGLDGAGGLSTRKRRRPEVEPPQVVRPAPAPDRQAVEAAALVLPAAEVLADDWEDEEAAVLAACALLLQ